MIIFDMLNPHQSKSVGNKIKIQYLIYLHYKLTLDFHDSYFSVQQALYILFLNLYKALD